MSDLRRSTETVKRPVGYYLLRKHEQEIVDTLIDSGFSASEAISEVVALVDWARR